MAKDTTTKNKLPFHFRLVFYRFSFKRKLKELTHDKNKIIIWLVLFIAFMSVVSGLFIFATFLHNLNNTYTIWGNGQIELDKSAQVGDFIGGVVGALWSFTGTLLFFIALQLQRTELIEMRKESQVNRLTDIIYRQLEYFDKSLQRFNIIDVDRQHNTYTGIDAVIFLRNKVESVIELHKENNNDKKKEIATKYYAENLALIMKNEESLLSLFEALDSSCDIIRAVLFKNSIPPSDLNELKAIFFKNIQADLLNSAEHLAALLDAYLTKMENDGEKRDRLFSPLHRLITKINVINEFRALVYDKKNTTVTDEMRQMYYST